METQWNEVPGFDGYYFADENGRIKTYKGNILKPTNEAGYLYLRVKCNGKWRAMKVHRMVAMTFIPNPDNKPTVNHINGIKTDNRVCNLEWMTMKENIGHAISTGLTVARRGEKTGTAKLTKEQVQQIKDIVGARETYKSIGERFGVSASAIGHIITGRSWEYKGKRKYPAKD